MTGAHGEMGEWRPKWDGKVDTCLIEILRDTMGRESIRMLVLHANRGIVPPMLDTGRSQ